MAQYEEEIFEQLYKEHPLAYEKKETKGVPNLKYKIKSISISGLVTLKFDKEVFQFEDLNSRTIKVI